MPRPSSRRRSRTPGEPFGPKETRLLSHAFNRAWSEVVQRGRPLSDERTARERIARAIIDTATTGERDPLALEKAGLACAGF
ncbi:MAG: hypothetical protein QOH65_1384 [Methylobacteriaceae bacterium]|jgi:hypothetical protein|nr:hypothetical protein [Methylobacteriaceae bacterium]